MLPCRWKTPTTRRAGCWCWASSVPTSWWSSTTPRCSTRSRRWSAAPRSPWAAPRPSPPAAPPGWGCRPRWSGSSATTCSGRSCATSWCGGTWTSPAAWSTAPHRPGRRRSSRCPAATAASSPPPGRSEPPAPSTWAPRCSTTWRTSTSARTSSAGAASHPGLVVRRAARPGHLDLAGPQLRSARRLGQRHHRRAAQHRRVLLQRARGRVGGGGVDSAVGGALAARPDAGGGDSGAQAGTSRRVLLPPRRRRHRAGRRPGACGARPAGGHRRRGDSLAAGYLAARLAATTAPTRWRSGWPTAPVDPGCGWHRRPARLAHRALPVRSVTSPVAPRSARGQPSGPPVRL